MKSSLQLHILLESPNAELPLMSRRDVSLFHRLCVLVLNAGFDDLSTLGCRFAKLRRGLLYWLLGDRFNSAFSENKCERPGLRAMFEIYQFLQDSVRRQIGVAEATGAIRKSDRLYIDQNPPGGWVSSMQGLRNHAMSRIAGLRRVDDLLGDSKRETGCA
jgi:hypothetical protein